MLFQVGFVFVRLLMLLLRECFQPGANTS